MNMLNVQRELRASDPRSALRKLVERLHIRTCETEDLVSLNYDQILSPKGDPVADECRGLILEKGTWRAVAYPFKRFYNVQEPHASKINLDECVLLEKLDGSLVLVYYYKGQWRIGTRGVPDASGSVGRDTQTFNDLVRTCIGDKYPHFWKTLDGKGEEFGPSWDLFGAKSWQCLCLVFEVIGPKNRVVTPYKETDLVLLTARDMDSLEELQPGNVCAIAVELGVRTPDGFSFKNMDHIMNLLPQLPPLNEGYVLTSHERDADGNYPRVKIKNPVYLAVAHCVQGGVSEEKMLEWIMNGSADTLVSFFEEYVGLRDAVKVKLLAFYDDVDWRFEELREVGKTSRKEFAEKAKTHRGSWLLFNLLDGRIGNAKEGVMATNAAKVMRGINQAQLFRNS
jgi:hypothetical protein